MAYDKQIMETGKVKKPKESPQTGSHRELMEDIQHTTAH